LYLLLRCDSWPPVLPRELRWPAQRGWSDQPGCAIRVDSGFGVASGAYFRGRVYKNSTYGSICSRPSSQTDDFHLVFFGDPIDCVVVRKLSLPTTQGTIGREMALSVLSEYVRY